MKDQNLYINIGKKLDEVHSVISDVQRGQTELKSEVRSMRDQLVKQNGRVTRLEESSNKRVVAETKLATEFEGHVKQDETMYKTISDALKELKADVRSNSKFQWRGMGVIAALSVIPILIALYELLKG